jgi:hypothetical protein
VGLDCGQKVIGSSVVQEKCPFADSPERSRPEHITLSQPLRNVIGETAAHVVNRQIGVEMRRLVLEGLRLVPRTRHHHGSRTKETPDTGIAEIHPEQLLAALSAWPGTRAEDRYPGRASAIPAPIS